MQVELKAHIAFHLTGRMPKGEGDALAGNDLRPALFAGYRDLAALRYDFPLVLVADRKQPVQSLAALFDAAVIAAGANGDTGRLRKHAERLERDVRRLAAEDAATTLSKLVALAADRLATGGDEQFKASLKALRGALKQDGEVIDCDKAAPFSAIRHAWQAEQERKAEKSRADINALAMKLSDILTAEFGHSKEGLSPERLQAAIGSAHRDSFDFAAMSRLLTEATVNVPMAESRRRRIRGLLKALRMQRFFPLAAENDSKFGAVEPYSFAFTNCADAIATYRERLPKMTELAKAMAMARLEVGGEYSEARHDAFFAEFGDNGLDAGDLAGFPDYLICLQADEFRAAEQDLILRAMAAGMPVKLVVQTDDLFEQSPIADSHFLSGLRGKQVTSAAMALGSAFVLQAPSSSLFQLREQIARGLAYPGPAVFSIYSGANGSGLPAYLAAAAAAESRVFPAFVYDPSAGSNWAARFSLAANSQTEADWPVQRFDYEDGAQQLVSETVAFTPIDFMACDPRFGRYFAKVPRTRWTGDLTPVAEFLGAEPMDLAEKVPCLLMVDGDNRLQKVIVNDVLIRQARHCAEAWRSLQELGGIHNSHAARLLEQEHKVWAEQAAAVAAEAAARQAASAPAPVASASPAPAAAPATAAPAAVETAPEHSPDEAWIETFRCSSCNECTQINDKMFAYDGNKQAYIKDINAGTYRQLVEAAENCQLSIIHPGKPRNPSEPGLDELLERAEPFL